MLDTHCHLTHARFAQDLDAVLARARAAGVSGCITIGTGVDDARAALALARRHAGYIGCAGGIDPFTSHRLGDAFDDEFEQLEALLRGGGFTALGEVGIDYHYDLDPPAVQAERLERQLDLAVRLDLPVVIHVRESHDDMLAVLAGHPGNRGVIHSFTAGPAEAERYVELGWYLAWNGVVTFKGAPEVREALRVVPADRILVETDSPYLAPIPLRGSRCEPAHIRHTFERIAAERQVEPAEIVRTTSANAARLGLGPLVQDAPDRAPS